VNTIVNDAVRNHLVSKSWEGGYGVNCEKGYVKPSADEVIDSSHDRGTGNFCAWELKLQGSVLPAGGPGVSK